MPIASVPRDAMFARLGRTMSDHEFEKLCFDFGVELDDITSERKMYEARKGDNFDPKAAEYLALADEVLYKIDVPANRYDLLCSEGIARALQVYQGLEPNPQYEVIVPAVPQVMTVKAETAQIRPFVVCAILRDVTFTQERYQSFIDLQDKLHQNICRQRTLVAIGTHDLDTIEGPFTYEARAPENISFVPLNEEKAFNGRELMHYYKEEKKQNALKPYLHIIEDSPVFPVIYDAKQRVLSLPPIINGDHSKIRLSTRNVLIECTATDLTKARITLNTVCAMFSEYCAKPFTMEAVDVKYEATGEQQRTPTMDVHEFDVDVAYINRIVGVDFTAEYMAEALNRMQLASSVMDGGAKLHVAAPPTRSDVLHACDISEDVAISHGYGKILRTIPASVTVGKENPLNKLSDQIRTVVSQAGFVETLTFILCSKEDNFIHLKREHEEKMAVVLDKPKSDLFKVARTSLLPGVLNTLKSNKGLVKIQAGIRVFELGDVVLLDDSKIVGARNERRVAAVYGGTTSGFEFIHGLLDQIMEANEAMFDVELAELQAAQAKGKDVEIRRFKHKYTIEESSDATFFPGRRADVFLNGEQVGVFGIVHPEVLAAFQINHPVSALELNLENFL